MKDNSIESQQMRCCDWSRKSERFQKYLDSCSCMDGDMDPMFAFRIRSFLNHPDLNKHCFVDAVYYDCSELSGDLAYKFKADMYLIFGITKKGEIISKWVNRWDVDSDLPIVNGEVVRETR